MNDQRAYSTRSPFHCDAESNGGWRRAREDKAGCTQGWPQYSDVMSCPVFDFSTRSRSARNLVPPNWTVLSKHFHRSLSSYVV